MSTAGVSVVYDCVVIGAGLSGLCAAKYLNEKKITNILVLEANSRVGGRIYTKRNEKVSWVDLGGSYVGPKQTNILRVAHELNVTTSKVFSNGNIIDIIDGKRLIYRTAGVAYNTENSFANDLSRFLEKVDEMGNEIPVEEPWNAPNAKQWDRITWKEFVESNCTQSVRNIALRIAADIFCTSPHELSLLFVLWYIKMGKGTQFLFSNVEGAQDSKFEGGSMKIPEKIAENLGASKVLTGKVVYLIDQTTKLVRIKTLDGCEYETRTVIMAVPPCLQNKIHYKPSLPALRSQMLQRFPMGSVIKCVLYYENAFWREKGYCGTSTIYGDENHIATVYDDTKSDGSKPALACFIFPEKSLEKCELSREKRKLMICKDLSKLFESQLALWPVHYEECNWSKSQYCGGGYTGICPPGFLTQFGRVMRKPVNKLFFAGTETATEFFGYMDGAVQAGERAAVEVIHELGYVKKL